MAIDESERGSDKKEDSVEERAGKRARTTVGGDGGDEEKEVVANPGGDDAYESPEAWAGEIITLHCTFRVLRGLIDGIFLSAWEEEMKQYAGWEKGEGARAGPMTAHQPCIDASGSF